MPRSTLLMPVRPAIIVPRPTACFSVFRVPRRYALPAVFPNDPRRPTTWLLAPALLLAATLTPAGGRETLALERLRLELPGAPAAWFATDVDRDGRRDLAVVLVY